MLIIKVPMQELFDEETNEFTTNSVTLELEHSLVSLSKWESEFEKPFLNKEDKTHEELLRYIEHMILTPDVSSTVLDNLTINNIDEINTYIASKQTASWVNESAPQRPSQEAITSELIYYWMTSFSIPWEAQHWHLNRLLMLIKIFNKKNTPPKKMNKREAAAQRRAINAKRRATLGTTG